MCSVWDEEQPMQVQGGGAHAGFRGVRGGGVGGVAGGGSRLLLPPHEGPPYHGSSRRRRLSIGFKRMSSGYYISSRNVSDV
ncbi:hypothetical protein BUALT_Bualt11G0060800 [Buddleja alternifolia]|uniref:Uncharacterized protein n=1 Tax=Buddleja alternifolia TaxID=168488 RepID=A0AAV6WRX3_9LAMI|nr:hypothetical protein BUALT_Bualt11G0060800 [Buddleja alternifolia]